MKSQVENKGVNDLSIFYYAGNIQPGTSWEDSLLKEIEDTDIFVPLLSDHYRDSANCLAELYCFCSRIELQRLAARTILPVVIGSNPFKELDVLHQIRPKSNEGTSIIDSIAGELLTLSHASYSEEVYNKLGTLIKQLENQCSSQLVFERVLAADRLDRIRRKIRFAYSLLPGLAIALDYALNVTKQDPENHARQLGLKAPELDPVTFTKELMIAFEQAARILSSIPRAIRPWMSDNELVKLRFALIEVSFAVQTLDQIRSQYSSDRRLNERLEVAAQECEGLCSALQSWKSAHGIMPANST